MASAKNDTFSDSFPTGLTRSDCDCVYFNSTYGKESGEFTSPDWPEPYEPGVNCFLYIFTSGEEQIVKVTFDIFNVISSTPTSGNAG